MELLTEDDVRLLINRAVASRDWWIIPWINELSGDLSLAIEQDYYAGEANADFVIFTGPLPVSIAHKSRMPARCLASILASRAVKPIQTVAEWSHALSSQDVIITLPEDEDAQAAAFTLVNAWHDWVIADPLVDH